nr:transposase [Ventosimonas gracilis]
MQESQDAASMLLANLLPAWKRELAWLKFSPAQTLQQSLKDLERAYANYFAKRAEFPRFKRKGVQGSFRYPQPQQIKLDEANSRIFLPKLGWLRYRNSRNIQGQVRNATVSLRAGKWFVSIQTEREVDQPLPEATSAIGIDMGIARFATFSNGSYLAPLNSFKRHETALKKAQQSLSRKEKFSSNWRKAKRKVQRLHARIGHARHDTCTKLQPPSAKTTRWYVLRICRYAICRNRRQARAKRRGATSKPNQG